MEPRVQDAAARAIGQLEAHLLSNLPAGTTGASVTAFFGRMRGSLAGLLADLVSQELASEPASQRLDRSHRGRWHTFTSETLRASLTAAQKDDSVGWLLSRVRVHRPDLFPTAEAWARSSSVIVPGPMPVPQPVPADDGGNLLIYDLPAEQVAQVPDVMPRTSFPRFAAIAYLNDDTSGAVLLDIAVAWFGQSAEVLGSPASSPPELDPRRLEAIARHIRANDPGADAEGRARADLELRLRLLAAAGQDVPEAGLVDDLGVPLPVSPIPTPAELLDSLVNASEPTSPAERIKANLLAVDRAEHPTSDAAANLRDLMGYSGYGGLSIDQVRDRLPARWVPSDAALVSEYYTPTKLALEIARVLRPWVPAMPRTEDGFVMALEPAAGIGRLLNAASTPGFEIVKWSAIEFSHVSATLLQAIRPDLAVVRSSFEEWVSLFEGSVTGKLGLTIANPPYGVRGPTITLDRNREYRENKAHIYFLRRDLDLLAGGGIGVFIIPYGFLTGLGHSFRGLRERVFRRHHLRAAFRLPSNLFPGAKLVTDLLIFESRGGELSAVLPEDQYIVDGQYFERQSNHILGTEVGREEDEDEGAAKPRWGYQVEGDFTELPPFEPRLRCVSCDVQPVRLPPTQASLRRRAMDSLPGHVVAAIILGDRVRRYLALVASNEHSKIGRAAALHPELSEALRAWADNLGQFRNPWQDRELQAEVKNHAEIVSFLAAFSDSGQLSPQVAVRPAWQPRYEGGTDDIGSQAAWVYSVKRELTTESLAEFRRSLGVFTLDPLESQLIASGWCFDDGNWLPERDYYSGFLWDKWARARMRARVGDTQSAAQLARLDQLIKPSRIDEIDAVPRMPWVPVAVLARWIERWTGRAIPNLIWRDSLLQLSDRPYGELADSITTFQTILIGYINHDLTYFKPPYEKQTDPTTGEEESAEAALDRARLEYSARAIRDFRDFLAADPEAATAIEESYNQLFRGYVVPEYSTEDLTIGRWEVGRIRLKPHQTRAARRLLANNGGLLALDVGVGKTYTGIATIARLREEGRARRPIVIVPNTIVWKWFKDFATALPDYRVVVIGSTRYLSKNGTYASKVDTPEERALKWRQFQAGEFDVAIVTYSMFARTQIRAESFREWAYETPVIVRKLGLESRELARKLGADGDEPKRPRITEKALIKLVGEARYKELTQGQKDALAEKATQDKSKERQAEVDRLLAVVGAIQDLSERERAIFGEAMDRWIAERQDVSYTPDPGIYFEDLGCDCLMVDEAQNFKNLWPVAQREGGVPKYLGAISEGSDRAWAFAVRAFITRKRTGGSGVHLLSATPAKNSPLEYFTLLGYVDGRAWTALGITDPDVFIDRYLRLELRDIISPDLSIARRSVVAGFKNLDELRSVIFRFAEFRTAQEVGLQLPRREIAQVFIPMDAEQTDRYEVLINEYSKALRRAANDPRAKMAALGLLQRMALVAIHVELDRGPGSTSASGDELTADSVGLPTATQRTAWTYRNADRVNNYHCPKIDKVAEMVMKRPDCGHLVFCDNVAVHRWLVMALVELGFPAERIAVFNSDQAKDPAKRQSMAERFNGTPAILNDDGTLEQEGIPPDFDVVIANATAYEGIDLHIRTCYVYNIDLPWEPATLQQRSGRAVRQGNTQAVIGIIYLLSERSLDAIRLNMILGKLNWMKDILASSDRETNNPAAQSDLSPDEMVLMLARDPEEARAAIQEQKRMLEAEQAERVRDSAWQSFRGLVARVNMLRRVNDPEDQAAVRREIDTVTERLMRIPAAVWPWHFMLDPVKAGRQVMLAAGLALPADARIMASPTAEHADLAGFATGQIFTDALGIRLFGTHRFERVRLERLDAGSGRNSPTAFEAELYSILGRLDAASVEQGALRWSDEEDRVRFEPALVGAIEQVANGEWTEMGLEGAGAEWRRFLVANYWPLISAAVRRSAGLTFLLPIRQGTETLVLRAASDAWRDDELVPFDFDSWLDFLRRAATSGAKWTELHETALAWWGKPFPRGILRSPDELSEVQVRTAAGRASVKPLARKGPLAVVFAPDRGLDHPDGPRFDLLHVPSGLAVFRNFHLEAVARSGMEYAIKQPIDWEAADPAINKLAKGFLPALKWLRAENQPRPVSQLQKYAAENG